MSVTVKPTVFPRTGHLPPITLRDYPVTLADAAAIAVAYADDIRASGNPAPRDSIAEAAMHGLMCVPGSSLVLDDLHAIMRREPTAADLLATALAEAIR